MISSRKPVDSVPAGEVLPLRPHGFSVSSLSPANPEIQKIQIASHIVSQKDLHDVIGEDLPLLEKVENFLPQELCDLPAGSFRQVMHIVKWARSWADKKAADVLPYRRPTNKDLWLQIGKKVAGPARLVQHASFWLRALAGFLRFVVAAVCVDLLVLDFLTMSSFIFFGMPAVLLVIWSTRGWMDDKNPLHRASRALAAYEGKIEKARASAQKARIKKYLAKHPEKRGAWAALLDHVDSSGVPVLVGDVTALKADSVQMSQPWR